MAFGDSIKKLFEKHGPGYQLTEGTTADCVNGTGSTLPVGRFMIKDSLSGDVISAKLPLAAAFTAKSVTSVITSVTSGNVISTIVFRGETHTVITPFDTDNNTTVANHVVALNAYFDALYAAGQSLLAAAAVAGTLTITAEIAGEDFEANTDGSTGTFTHVVAGTTLVNLLIGVSLDQGAAVLNESDAVVIRDGVGFSCARMGDVSVAMAAAAATSRGNALYVITGSDAAEAGKVTESAGAGRVWVPRNLVRWSDASATSTFQPRGAVARVSLYL